MKTIHILFKKELLGKKITLIKIRINSILLFKLDFDYLCFFLKIYVTDSNYNDFCYISEIHAEH